VLSAWTHIFPDDGYNVVCVSHDGVPATCRLGLVIDVPHWFETMPHRRFVSRLVVLVDFTWATDGPRKIVHKAPFGPP